MTITRPRGRRPARAARAQPAAGRSVRTSWSIRTRCADRPAGRGRPRRPGGRDRAGLGSLTVALAETGAEVTAVEIDRHLLPGLARGGRAARRARWSQGDALALDWAAVLAGHDDLGAGGQPALQRRHAARARPARRACRPSPHAVMVQREVGERLAAAPGDDGLRHPVGEGRLLGHGRGRRPGAARRCSCPGPRSSRRWCHHPPAGPRGRRRPRPLFALVRAGFGQRRKMLRRSLAGRGDIRAVRAGRHPAGGPRPRSSASPSGVP